MANLEFLNNVVHNGIVLKKGMIVSDVHQGLAEVGSNLIDRGLAKETAAAATHTAAIVNGAQEPLEVNNTSGGQAPNADSDAALKAQAKARQQEADTRTQNQVNEQAGKESQVVVKAAPGAENKPQAGDPTNEDIAAAAAAA